MSRIEIGEYLVPRWLVAFAMTVLALLLFWIGALVMAQAAEWSLIQPPARFDHEYAGRLYVDYVKEDVTRRMCDGIGCSYLYPSGWCHIFISTDSNIPPEMIRRHEIGHCNGWSTAHEDGHLVSASGW